MANIIEQIKQRIKDLYSNEYNADVLVPNAISYLIKKRKEGTSLSK
jgi:hypothetical protein